MEHGTLFRFCNRRGYLEDRVRIVRTKKNMPIRAAYEGLMSSPKEIGEILSVTSLLTVCKLQMSYMSCASSDEPATLMAMFMISSATESSESWTSLEMSDPDSDPAGHAFLR